jgi:DNA-binding transcriptional ArsR family regulator
MKRDMDLVRKILLESEESESPDIPKNLSVEGYTQEQIKYHLKLLRDADLITTVQYVPLFESKPESALNVKVAVPSRLTWQGHEFLDAVRNENVWNKTKEIVKEKGGSLTFGVIKDLAIQIARQMVGLP